MIKQICKILLISATLTVSLCGCSLSREKDVASDTDAIEHAAIKDMRELKNNHFYIYSSKTHEYRPVYMNRATFQTDPDHLNTSVYDTRSLFFTDDWDYIPTCYTGDSLVYFNDTTIPEDFIIERFEDLKYSIGIINIQMRKDGKFWFSAQESEKDTNPYINPDSDANQLFEDLNSPELYINTINGIPLEPGHFNRAGAIDDLTKGKEYTFEIYEGHQCYPYKLHADTRILTSMEVYTNIGSTFIKDEPLLIDIPDYFKTGFYMINGQGIFRLVRGNTYSEDSTSFNNPNIIPADEATSVVTQSSESDNPEENESIQIRESGDYIFTLTFNTSGNDLTSADTYVRLVGPDCAYTFTQSPDDPNKFTLEVDDIKITDYNIKIDNNDNTNYYVEYNKKDKD